MRQIVILLILAAISPIASAQVVLSDVSAALKKATAGDTITIANGVYSNQNLVWKAVGTAKKPIVIRAEKQGGVVISGESSLRLVGEWLTVDGLLFTNGYSPRQNVVEFRAGDDVANHCTLTNTVIDGYCPADRSVRQSYIGLYGRYNTVSHCSFLNKLNFGVTLIVWLNEERSLQNFHNITQNYFGRRPVYGSNGAETIRVGTSREALESSNTTIEGNMFEECNGEVEVVSIKSSDNVIKNNLFLNCEGVLALRHGDRNVVSNNTFIGSGRRNTGGVRIINAGHIVSGNYFDGLAGTRFFSALAVMNAVPNSLPNRYCQVLDVQILGNYFKNCASIGFGIGRDAERTLPPDRVLFAENSIVNTQRTMPFDTYDKIDGITFRANRVELSKKTKLSGFGNYADLHDANFDHLSTDEMHKTTGAAWYNPSVITCSDEIEPREVRVGSAAELSEAIKNACPQDIIILTEGEYALNEGLVVSVPLTVRAAAEKPVIRYRGTSGQNMFTIASGGSLTIEDIVFDGRVEDGRASASAAISSDKVMLMPYTLTVSNCEFRNFGESTFYPIRALANTFAETVTVKGSTFRDLSGDAINFAAERDDVGKYNADDVVIENCSFERMLGIAVNIYRGGSDESTAGPYVSISGCSFNDVCNKERGAVLRLIGVQMLDIAGNTFVDSGRGGASIKLDEATWERISIRGNTFRNSGRIASNTGLQNK